MTFGELDALFELPPARIATSERLGPLSYSSELFRVVDVGRAGHLSPAGFVMFVAAAMRCNVALPSPPTVADWRRVDDLLKHYNMAVTLDGKLDSSLHRHAARGHVTAVSSLLSSHVNPNAWNAARMTPYDVTNSSIIRRMLVQAGAWPPFVAAARAGNTSKIKELRNGGIQGVDEEDKVGAQALDRLRCTEAFALSAV